MRVSGEEGGREVRSDGLDGSVIMGQMRRGRTEASRSRPHELVVLPDTDDISPAYFWKPRCLYSCPSREPLTAHVQGIVCDLLYQCNCVE